MFGIKSYFFHMFLVSVIMVECTKFDIEVESQKLFGEDLNSVLKKFRRSHEYLKILQNQLADIKAHIIEMTVPTLYYYNQALHKRLNEIVGLNETISDEENTEFLRFRWLRNREQPIKRDLQEVSSDSKIEYLDNYHSTQSSMSVQDRNTFVDLGFEYAGMVIQSIIKSLGSEDDGVKSTMLDNIKHSSTMHGHKATTKIKGSTVGLRERSRHKFGRMF